MTPPTSQMNERRQVDEKMIDYDDSERFHSRRSLRLKQYGYSTPNCYFITICTWNKVCIFGGPGELNQYGRIAQWGLQEIEKHFPSVKVDNFVIMPNHIHAILTLQKEDANLSVVVGQYKSFVTRRIHLHEPNCKVWQTSFHDHVIRDQKGYEHIWLYIEANPENWEKDCFHVGKSPI